MTEIEKIEYAKSFIDKLANGVNPLDGSQIKEDDIVNNVRISRCLCFVSDVLRQVVENGGIKKKTAKIPFTLTLEERTSFEYSDTPIPVSEITKRFNDLITNEDMKKLSHRNITEWLISIDMLYEMTKPDGKTTKRPTEHGMAVGITTENRTGPRGEYVVTVYCKKAQEIIVDNLDAVLVPRNRNKLIIPDIY